MAQDCSTQKRLSKIWRSSVIKQSRAQHIGSGGLQFESWFGELLLTNNFLRWFFHIFFSSSLVSIQFITHQLTHKLPHPLHTHFMHITSTMQHTHTLFTWNLKPLPHTQLHHEQDLPCNNSISKFSTDQPVLSPNQNDPIYAIKHYLGGF